MDNMKINQGRHQKLTGGLQSKNIDFFKIKFKFKGRDKDA